MIGYRTKKYAVNKYYHLIPNVKGASKSLVQQVFELGKKGNTNMCPPVIQEREPNQRSCKDAVFKNKNHTLYEAWIRVGLWMIK